MDQIFPPWPPKEWQIAIGELVEGNGMLGPQNNAFERFAQDPAVAKLALALVASLNSTDSASEARRLLESIRAACRNEADNKAVLAMSKKGPVPDWTGPSRLATTTYNDLLEPINAKRLWQVGHAKLYPWPFNEKAKKPDYTRSTRPAGKDADKYYEETTDIGDQIKVGGKTTAGEVATEFASSVRDKVTTYPGKSIWVVVDLCDNAPMHEKGLDVDVFTAQLAQTLKVTLSKVGNRGDLFRATAVFPREARTLGPSDWN
jgi:hypothetical protein